MAYSVSIDRIAEDVPTEVRDEILLFLLDYGFPYVATVSDNERLRAVYSSHFTNRQTLDWLKDRLEQISSSRRGVVAIALTETNRIHTWGLSKVLLRKGQTKCTTTHSYGVGYEMSPACIANLEGRELDIREILGNTFPADVRELQRVDIPMVPQHVNCRHVLSPIGDLLNP